MKLIQTESFLILKTANIGKPGDPIEFNFDYPLDPTSIPVEPAKDRTGVAPDRFSGHESQIKAFVPFMSETDARLARYIIENMKRYYRGAIPRVVAYAGHAGISLDGCNEIDMDEFEDQIGRLAESRGLPSDGIPELEHLFKRMLSAWLDHGERRGDQGF